MKVTYLILLWIMSVVNAGLCPAASQQPVTQEATTTEGVFPGDVTGVDQEENAVIVTCGASKIRFEIWSDDVIRIWASPEGSFNYYNDYNNYLIEPGLAHFTGPQQLEVTDDPAQLVIQTSKLILRIEKKPFRMLFFEADGKSLITCNPTGQTLRSDMKAYFKRDANGQTEHFFGLQGQGEDTLDQRDMTRVTKDANGHGWVSPFFMSTAGYGIFFNNEYGWENKFSMNDPIVIENVNQDGQMDLFFMYGPGFKSLLDIYTDLTGKPPLLPKKRFGFNYIVQGTFIDHEEALPEWIERGYPIDSCITFTDQCVETQEQLDAVKATGERIHATHRDFGFYYDLKPCPGTFPISLPEDITYPHDQWDAFKNVLTERLFKRGVDWFWVDETDDYGKIDNWDERFAFHLYRAMAEAMESYDSRRAYTLGRGGYAGCQRFAFPWMGDIDYDRKCVLANINNGLIGVPHSTHDLAGAQVLHKTEIAYLQGAKANLLNPLTMCNSWIPNQKPCQKPWEWSPHAESVFRKFLTLHYQLIPYFYTTAWQAHTSGLPDWRALVIDHPNDANVYDSDELMIGDWLLMAPLYDSLTRDVYLPEGKWHYYFGDQEYEGPQTLSDFTVAEESYPLFVKAGAIIPMMPVMNYVGEKAIDPLTLDIYPFGKSDYTLYEDDGVTREYLQGQSCLTRFECITGENGVAINIFARTGAYDPGARSYMLKVSTGQEASGVKVDRVDLPRLVTLEDLMNSSEGWGYYEDAQRGSLCAFVKFPDSGMPRNVQISLEAAVVKL